jgi:hypothetical protein
MSANAPRSIDEYLRQLRTEAKVKAALKPPAPPTGAHTSGVRRFFGVFMDVRAYTSLFYMLLTLATGIVYFTFVVSRIRDPGHRHTVLPGVHRHCPRDRTR